MHENKECVCIGISLYTYDAMKEANHLLLMRTILGLV